MKVVMLLGSLLFSSALAAVSEEEGVSFRFSPALPSPTEVVKIEVTYLTSCFLEARPRVIDGRVLITVVEGCVCPAVLPMPFTFTIEVGPLELGVYEVVLEKTIEDPQCQPNEPFFLGSASLVVAARRSGELSIELEPASPAAGDEVKVVITTGCPATFHRPAIVERLILIPEELNRILAPCFDEPRYRHELELGLLAPDVYTLILLFTEPGQPTSFTTARTFAVTPAESDEVVLDGDRFRLTARWRSAGGKQGEARGVTLTRDSGYFWFFGRDNIEVVAKVLTACQYNGHRWVFAAGLTTVEVELLVEDRLTGQTRLYFNPLGRAFLPITDTTAFACP